MIVKSKLASFFCGAVALPLFAAAAAVSTVSTVSAQKAPRKIERTVSPVTSGLNAADIADFRRALTTLALRGKVDCIAEGKPLQNRLTPDKAAQVLREANRFETLAEAIADAYDYRIDRSGGVLRFLKRYNDPDDLPEVTYAEAVATLQEIQAIFSGFVPARAVRRSDGQDPLLFALTSTLSDAQKSAMATGIPISELSDEQKRALQSIGRSIQYRGPLSRAGEILAWSKRLKAEDVRFACADGDGADPQPVTVYRTLTSFETGRKETRNLPLCTIETGGIQTHRGVVVDSLNRGKLTAFREREKQNGAVPDPDNSTDPAFLTLREVAGRLNRASGTQKSPLRIDAKVASHTVTFVRGGASSPLDLLQSLAFVYGLEVRRLPDGSTVAARKTPRAIRDATDVSAALTRVLPAPLLRCFSASGLRVQEKNDRAERRSDPLFVEGTILSDRTRQGAKGLQENALCCLALLLEKEIAAHSESQEIRLSRISGASQDALGRILLLQCLPRLVDVCLVQPVPAYLSNPDSQFLGGGITSNAQGSLYITVLLGPRQRNGGVIGAAGMGPGRYLP